MEKRIGFVGVIIENRAEHADAVKPHAFGIWKMHCRAYGRS